MPFCEICCTESSFEHDHKPDHSGLDDGPFLIGQAPRKRAPLKSPEEMAEIRARAWETRRRKYGFHGHR